MDLENYLSLGFMVKVIDLNKMEKKLITLPLLFQLLCRVCPFKVFINSLDQVNWSMKKMKG